MSINQNTEIETIQPEHRLRLLKWADALDSGKYKQAKNSLFNGTNGYCCLGVMCEIAKGAGNTVVAMAAGQNLLDRRGFADDVVNHHFGIDIRSETLVYGKDSILTFIKNNDLSRPMVNYLRGAILSTLNDHENWTFKQIAGLIRSLALKPESNANDASK